jgi:hypothetical protein
LLLAGTSCGQARSPAGDVPARDDSGAAAATDLSGGGGGSFPDDTAATAIPGTAPSQGELPQTEDKPSADSEQFRAGVDALWRAIVEDDPDLALGFFFPLAAYRQVKNISNPDQDYENRLIRQYREDIHSWHRQLGPDPSAAIFIDIDIPQDAQWMRPGTEYNKLGYWRVLNAKLAYELDGMRRVFTIASMISWRGEWYAVHLAAIK